MNSKTLDIIPLQEYNPPVGGYLLMIIYHGSRNIIPAPIFGYGRETNDYGKGFYCTEKLDLACEWAVDLDYSGYANCYEIDINEMSVLDLSDGEYGILEWMAILLTYRDLDIQFPLQAAAREYLIDNFYVDVDEYDVVKGYRADDSFFSFARAFLSNTISYEQLRQALYLGDLGQQIVLKSERAFECIKPKGYISADAAVWYPRKQNRDLGARKKYNDMLSASRVKGAIYINNIIEEEMKRYDVRL